MRKSYSRIRHIEETNLMLESRFLSEKRNRLFEQSSSIKGVLIKKVPGEKWEEGNGFFYSRVSNDTDITSILNKGSDGEVQSKKNSLFDIDTKTNNTYAGTYWKKGAPNEKFSITINGNNVTSKIDITVDSNVWTGYMFNFTNIPVGTYTIQSTNDEVNKLTITVSQSVDCEKEWKTLFDMMETAADKGDVDLRPYYCSKDETNYIKGKFPNIDDGKVSCLLKKIKKQYCVNTK